MGEEVIKNVLFKCAEEAFNYMTTDVSRMIYGDPHARYNQPEWVKQAIAMQLPISQLLGDREWDKIRAGDWKTLRRKVGFALFSQPQWEPAPSNKNTGYDPFQLERIDKLCEKITKGLDFDTCDIHFGVVFIVIGFDKAQVKEQKSDLMKQVEKDFRDNNNNNEKEWAGKEVHDKIMEPANQEKLAKCNDDLPEDQVLPVFKCKLAASSKSYTVVDSWDGRVYKSWADLIDEEKLPGMCRYCVPKNGVYSWDERGNIELEFRYPNADSTWNLILELFEKLLGIVEFATIAGALFCPCLIPVAGIVVVFSAVYHTTRSSIALADRSSHDQGIGLDDPTARGHWMTIAISVLSLATASLSLAGKALGGGAALQMNKTWLVRGARLCLILSNTAVITTHVLGFTNQICGLFEISRRRKLVLEDFRGIGMELLAFGNTVVNFKRPSKVIKQAQADFRSMAKANLPMELCERNRGAKGDVFKALKQNAGSQLQQYFGRKDQGKNEVQDWNEIQVGHTLDLMRALCGLSNNPLASEGLQKYFTSEGVLNIDKTNFSASCKWLPLEEQSRLDLYFSTERYASAVEITAKKLQTKQQSPHKAQRELTSAKDDHLNTIKELCKTYEISFDDMHQSTMEALCTLYSEVLQVRITSPEQILLGGRPFFGSLSGHLKTRLAQVLGDTLDNRSDLLRLVHSFAEHMKCKGFRRYLKLADLVANQFYEKRTEILNDFRQRLLNGQSYAQVRKHISGLLGVVESLEGPMIKHADALAIRYFEGEDKLVALEGLRKVFEAANEDVSEVPVFEVPLGVLSADLASHRYQKHKYFEFAGGFKLETPEECFEVAANVFGLPVVKDNAIVTQDGTCTIVTQKCPERGVLVVVINKFYDAGDGNSSGIVTCLSYASL